MKTSFLKLNFRRFLAGMAACFLLNASALAYSPAVHALMHCHEHTASSESGSVSNDFCSAKNHLASDLAAEAFALQESFKFFGADLPTYKDRAVFLMQPSSAPRAPPVSPAK